MAKYCCPQQLWWRLTLQRLRRVVPLPQQSVLGRHNVLIATVCLCRNSWPKRRRNVRLWAEVQPYTVHNGHEVLNPMWDRTILDVC